MVFLLEGQHNEICTCASSVSHFCFCICTNLPKSVVSDNMFISVLVVLRRSTQSIP